MNIYNEKNHLTPIRLVADGQFENQHSVSNLINSYANEN